MKYHGIDRRRVKKILKLWMIGENKIYNIKSYRPDRMILTILPLISSYYIYMNTDRTLCDRKKGNTIQEYRVVSFKNIFDTSYRNGKKEYLEKIRKGEKNVRKYFT